MTCSAARARNAAARAKTARPVERDLESAPGQAALDIRVRLPMTRGECRSAPRPCPFVSCKHHLYLDVSPITGRVKLNFPDLEVWELEESCALDIADAVAETGELLTTDVLGTLIRTSHEGARMILERALAKLRRNKSRLTRELAVLLTVDGPGREPGNRAEPDQDTEGEVQEAEEDATNG